MDSQNIQSFAWYMFAMARVAADAQKCTDGSCQSPASLVPMNFHSNLGALSHQWISERRSDTSHYRIALALYENNPQTSHQPNWLADQGMNNYGRAFGMGSTTDRFLPEDACIEIERKSLEALHKIVREHCGDARNQSPPPAYTPTASGT